MYILDHRVLQGHQNLQDGLLATTALKVKQPGIESQMTIFRVKTTTDLVDPMHANLRDMG